MNISGLVRLTADAVMATTKNGKQVLQIKAVCNNGFGDNQRAVWIDASMFGDRGAKIVDYLKKGNQVCLHGDSVEAHGYQGKDGIQTSLRMNVINVELVARSEQASQPKPQYTPQPSLTAPQGGDFLNDEIPF